jgi:hypothetical protein
MKKTILILLTSVLVSCSLIMLQEKGSVKIENGEGKRVSVSYEIFDLKKVEQHLNKSEFDKIVPDASVQAKKTCKYPLTYEPISFRLYLDNELTIICLDFSAKNGFGVPSGKAGYTDHIAPILVDHLNFLTINLQEWSMRIGQGWSTPLA